MPSPRILCPLAALLAAALSFAQSTPTGADLEPRRVQWADRVLGYSSQAGDKVFSAKQALGKPNKMPAMGLSGVAWMPDMRSGLEEEWLKLAFAEAMPVEQIAVAENARPGALREIILFDESGRAALTWTNPDTLPVKEKGRMLRIFLDRTEFNVQYLMLVLRPTDSLAIHQIDAVAIANHQEEFGQRINLVPGAETDAVAENLGPQINSFFDEVFPVISPDGQSLFFDRKNHPGNTGNRINDDIWVSRLDSASGWSRARQVGPPLNTIDHNFVCSISPDGNTLLLGNAYQDDGQLTDGLSISHRGAQGWEKPVALEIEDYYNLDEYAEYQLAANGKVILMAVERKDSEGKRDLYASFLMPGGRWAAPMHLGPDLNTAGLEMSPFLASDMRTLYFSSNGYPGYGKSDMFVSRRLDGSWKRWSEPLNLGPAINSEGLDAYYTLPATGDYAYFASSNRAIGRTDLFRIALPEELQPEPVVMIAGQVLDAVSGEGVQAEIRYLFESSGEEAGLARSVAPEGDYRIVLPYGEAYAFRAEAQGYFALNEHVDLSRVEEFQEIDRDLIMVPLREGQIIPLREIYFEVNRAVLLPESHAELDRVVAMLAQRPDLVIEIGGHTNDRCDESFCNQLSERRAKRVARYLVSAGAESDQIKSLGYGKSQPIADNSTPEGRQKNQRVEFKILESGED